MKTVLRQLWFLVAKDLQIEARSHQTLGLVTVLGILILVVLGLGLGRQELASGSSATAVLWVAYLFSGVLCFEKTMSVERQDGALAGLMLAPVDWGLLFVAKLIGNLVLLGTLVIIITAAGVLFLGFNVMAGFWPFVIITSLGMLGFAAVGTLFSAAVSSSRLAGGLLALLIFPICLPLVITSIQMLLSVFRDANEIDSSGLAILIAFDCIYLVISWLVFELLLEP